MLSINIRTTQNVAIDYVTAGLGDRIGAFLIDVLIVGAYVIVMALALTRLTIDTNWVFMLFYLPAFFYHLISEIAFNGQSLGKKQMNIKVVRLDGAPATIGGYILRWILRPLDIGIFSGAIAVISIALTQNAQRLGDLAAGTTVVKIASAVKVTSHQLIKNLDSDYQPVFSDAQYLSNEEVNIIKQALEVNKHRADMKPAIAVSRKVKEHLKVQSYMPTIKILYTLLKDYNHYTSQ